MKTKTKRLLQVMIWVSLIVMIGTCLWASVKEQGGDKTATMTDQAIVLGIVATCMFLIATLGIILMLKADPKQAKKELLSKRH